MKITIRRLVAAGLSVAATIVAVACSDLGPATNSRHPAAVVVAPPGGGAALPASCGLSYTVVSVLEDTTLQNQYGIATLVDTARVCETWTGFDYVVDVEQVGSSEPRSEVSDPMYSARYGGGQATLLDAYGNPVSDPTTVSSDAFSLGLASAEERQASYNDPYYGILQSDEPSGCPGDPTAIVCNSTPAAITQLEPGVAAIASAAPANPHSAQVGKKEHKLKRKALRALLAASNELPAAANGNRRFGRIDGDVETTIEVDPATELVAAQESRHAMGHTKARLTWAKQNGRWVRERMDVEGLEVVDGQSRATRVTILISNIVGGQP